MRQKADGGPDQSPEFRDVLSLGGVRGWVGGPGRGALVGTRQSPPLAVAGRDR